jgi:hypothetical protein
MLATLCYKCVNEWLISHELEFASPFQEQRLHEFGLRGSSEKSTFLTHAFKPVSVRFVPEVAEGVRASNRNPTCIGGRTSPMPTRDLPTTFATRDYTADAWIWREKVVRWRAQSDCLREGAVHSGEALELVTATSSSVIRVRRLAGGSTSVLQVFEQCTIIHHDRRWRIVSKRWALHAFQA